MAKGLVILHCLVFVSVCLPPVAGCLYGCVCDENTNNVHCENIEKKTLHSLLLNIPGNTQVLTIANSVLIQPPTEGESEEHVVYELPHLEHLHSVTLTNTNISETDLSLINHISSLWEIHVTSCAVRQLYVSQWSLLHDLVTLNLSHNAIADIEEHAFEGLTSLHSLILRHNNLQHIPISAFDDLESLEQIDLSHNHIEYIHPMTFFNMSYLQVVYLQSNELTTLHHSTFGNISGSLKVHLNDNFWDCNCGLYWLIRGIGDPGIKRQHFVDWENLVCAMPSSLKGEPLHTVASHDLICEAPAVETFPDDVQIHNMHNQLLNCSAGGEPHPSVYWITPFGTLAHQIHRRWMSEAIPQYRNVIWYAGQPTYYNSSIHALPNGSLAFHNFRYYFAGEYTCVVENPAGLSSVSVNVTIATNINQHFEYSIIIGFIAGLIIMFIGIIVGAVRMIAEKCCKCCQEKGQYKVDVTFVVDTPHGEAHIDYNFDEPYDYSPFSDGTWPRFTPFLPHWSPYHSPKKCVTPAEGLGDEDEIKDGGTIRDTLEDVRSRLKQGLERASGRLRNRTQTVKENTSKKIQTIKESTSQTMATIRESGSIYVRNLGKATGDYAQRVKVGMSVGVSQVKSQVQSMKELCGTGNLPQTVSVATVLTEKDKVEDTDFKEIDLKEIIEESCLKDVEQGVVTEGDWDNCQASTSGTVTSTPSGGTQQRHSVVSSSDDSCSLQSQSVCCQVDMHVKRSSASNLDQNQIDQEEDGTLPPVHYAQPQLPSSSEEEEPKESDTML